MLSEEQVLVVPGCHPDRPSCVPGRLGRHTVDSLSRTRIITADQQTLIAQLGRTPNRTARTEFPGCRHLSVVADAVAPDAPVDTGAGPSQITFTPGCER